MANTSLFEVSRETILEYTPERKPFAYCSLGSKPSPAVRRSPHRWPNNTSQPTVTSPPNRPFGPDAARAGPLSQERPPLPRAGRSFPGRPSEFYRPCFPSGRSAWATRLTISVQSYVYVLLTSKVQLHCRTDIVQTQPSLHACYYFDSAYWK